jgi:hypothetical protein
VTFLLFLLLLLLPGSAVIRVLSFTALDLNKPSSSSSSSSISPASYASLASCSLPPSHLMLAAAAGEAGRHSASTSFSCICPHAVASSCYLICVTVEFVSLDHLVFSLCVPLLCPLCILYVYSMYPYCALYVCSMCALITTLQHTIPYFFDTHYFIFLFCTLCHTSLLHTF